MHLLCEIKAVFTQLAAF